LNSIVGCGDCRGGSGGEGWAGELGLFVCQVNERGKREGSFFSLTETAKKNRRGKEKRSGRDSRAKERSAGGSKTTTKKKEKRISRPDKSPVSGRRS